MKREFEKFRKCRKASWWSAEEVESPERVFLPQHTANVIVLWVLGLYIFASFSWHSNTRNFRVFFFWSRVHHQFQLLFVFVFCSTNDISLPRCCRVNVTCFSLRKFYCVLLEKSSEDKVERKKSSMWHIFFSFFFLSHVIDTFFPISFSLKSCKGLHGIIVSHQVIHRNEIDSSWKRGEAQKSTLDVKHRRRQ